MDTSMRWGSIAIFLLSCSPVFAESETFPPRMRGFWAINQATCDMLKSKAPAYLHRDQEWIKIGAIDVLGSIQGRYFRKTPDQDVVPNDGAGLSFEIQTFDGPTIFEQLTLSRNGYLYDTIVDARSSGKFQRC